MLKKILLFSIVAISSTYTLANEQKVICQITFDVPDEMSTSFHTKSMDIIIEKMTEYSMTKNKRVKIKKNIVGVIKDSFTKSIRKIEGDKVYNLKDTYYILDTDNISLSVRKSSCLDYSKKIEQDMEIFRKAKEEELARKKDNPDITVQRKTSEVKKKKKTIVNSPKTSKKEFKDELKPKKLIKKETVKEANLGDDPFAPSNEKESSEKNKNIIERTMDLIL